MAVRVAIMDGERVVNVAVWDGETPWSVDGARIIADGLTVGPGWRWDGLGWIEPPAVDLDAEAFGLNALEPGA